ncbi:hypothetical protein U0C82_06555 [Fulvimarina sp. 2208YS6-2-32]|uniref:Uncharacterized protein n=1 Tax=Fulvimarina uroteuthidis TaxID=3098149 RepID=A0ABU5I155_9HYPH|nr:hypothetical protein [Fulvimarina sp. 2208YS6-2-32]MDY8108805.1 hypothetical protein [Fulvimarina sp. 2208YS6-2-32]
MAKTNQPARPRKLRSALIGLVDSVQEARRLQAEIRRKYPHLAH